MPHADHSTLANEQMAYVTTTGRISGTAHRIEIWFALDGETMYLLSGGRERSDWVRNLQANPAVTVEIGNERFAGSARVIEPDSAEDGRARELVVEKYRKGDELDSWGRTSLAVAVDLI